MADHSDVAGERRHGSTSKAPGAVQSTLAIFLCILVALLALEVSQPPPPSIAEFAPQAIAPPETAQEQAGKHGTGAVDAGTGGGLPGGLGASVPPPVAASVPPPPDVVVKAPIVKSRQKRCVGNPPRQIEDPQSPPCIDYWDGDNGGKTYRGVTANEVRLSVIEAGAPWPQIEAFKNFFNARFQFYGRKITIQKLCCQQLATPDQERGFAQAAYERQVFAALGQGSPTTGAIFARELAAKGILSATYFPLFTEREMSSLHPYVWQYRAAADVEFGAMGQWTCARLSGQKAAHARGNNDEFNPPQPMAGQVRKFAVYHSKPKNTDSQVGDLVKSLASCGVNVDKQVTFSRDAHDPTATQPNNAVMQSDVLAMKKAGVTTVICICFYNNLLAVMGAATSQKWTPEWVSSTFGGADCNYCVQRFLPRDQRDRLFGVSTENKHIPTADDAYCVALREQGMTCPAGGHNGTINIRLYYEEMLLIASGIQMAGPNLTPESFGRGLRTTIFPNPDYYTKQALVGFASGHAMQRGGLTEIYWREGATDPEDSALGAHCYVAGGRRYERGQFPKGGDPFFPANDANGASCDSGTNPKRT